MLGSELAGCTEVGEMPMASACPIRAQSLAGQLALERSSNLSDVHFFPWAGSIFEGRSLGSVSWKQFWDIIGV